MMDILNLYKRGIQHLNHRGYIYVWVNVIWVLLTIPVITAPVAWAALAVHSHRSHTRAQINIQEFWLAFRQYFWLATLNGIISIPIVMVNLNNLLVYRPVDIFGMLLMSVWLMVLVVWIGMQLYLWSIMEELKQPSLWLAYRNAFIMVNRNLLLTFALLPGVLFMIFIGVAVFPILMLITGSSVAILGTSGALLCLKRIGYDNPEHYQWEQISS